MNIEHKISSLEDESKQLREIICCLQNTIKDIERERSQAQIKYKTELASLDEEISGMSLYVIIVCVPLLMPLLKLQGSGVE